MSGGLFHGKVGHKVSPGQKGSRSVWAETDGEVLFPRDSLQPLAHAHSSFSVLLHFLQGFARIRRTLVSGVHVGFV